MFPSPAEFGMRRGDKVIYIGTLRLHRDEFHEVTKAEIRDDYERARRRLQEEVSLRFHAAQGAAQAREDQAGG